MANALEKRGSGETGLIDDNPPGGDVLQGEDLVLAPERLGPGILRQVTLGTSTG